jgi:hypothetical protein
MTGVVIASISVAVAWATSFLKPPKMEEATERLAAAGVVDTTGSQP